MRVVDWPVVRAALHAPVSRELHGWLLSGRRSARIRGIAHAGGTAHRIGQAVTVLRAEFARPLYVGQRVAVAGMCASSFRQHVRAVTPCQVQSGCAR